VRSIVFSNKPAWLMQPRLHVDALMKINGEWKPEEDWTAENFKSFCRDSKEERLEELVVIYSNSDPVRPRETTVVRLDGIPGLPGDVDFIPKVDASNAGCWRWEVTSKITTTDTYGLKIVTSVTVTFDRVRATGESPDGAGQELYSTKAQAGPATYSINGPFLGTCDVTGSGSGAIADSDGIMNIRFNQPKDPDNRVVLSGDGTSAMSVTQTVTCPNSPPQTTTQSVSPAWMSLPDNSALSEDGQTISGKLVESDAAGGTKVTEWNLTAARE